MPTSHGLWEGASAAVGGFSRQDRQVDVVVIDRGWNILQLLTSLNCKRNVGLVMAGMWVRPVTLSCTFELPLESGSLNY
jgi:hypothetical protein